MYMNVEEKTSLDDKKYEWFIHFRYSARFAFFFGDF